MDEIWKKRARALSVSAIALLAVTALLSIAVISRGAFPSSDSNSFHSSFMLAVKIKAYGLGSSLMMGLLAILCALLALRDELRIA